MNKTEFMNYKMKVIAIRIYLGGYTNTVPMADLKMVDGVTETIEWTNIKQRKQFERGINGYTLIYDERPKREWNEW